MNKPVPSTGFQAADPAYEEDGYGWAMHQAALIRAGERVNLDWENIAEEIEDVAKSEQRAVESALTLALVHVLKWDHQPSRRSRSWENSIPEHLRRFDRLMGKNPGLKPHLGEILAESYRDARFEASQETGLEVTTFPEAPPDWNEVRTPRTMT